MISSRTGKKHREHASDLGVDRFLGKPFHESELLSTIAELVGLA
jgi:chemosensory pili system protein ChpA (sensor histidine kinase/response regulator)